MDHTEFVYPSMFESHDLGQSDLMGATNEPKDISVNGYLHGNAEYPTFIQTSQICLFLF